MLRLRRIQVENFKNFADPISVDISKSNESGYSFAVVVGRNGSGKSCLLDAVEFVLFHRTSKSKDEFIHMGKDIASCSLMFSNDEGSSLTLTKTIRRGLSGKFYAIFEENNQSLRRIEGAENIGRLLFEKCGIQSTNLSRMVVKQMDASAIAISTPLNLLNFLDVAIGTDKLKAEVATALATVEQVSRDRMEILEERRKVFDIARQQRPGVDTALAILTDKRELNQALYSLYTAQLEHLRTHHHQLTTEKGSLQEQHNEMCASIVEATKQATIASNQCKSALLLERKYVQRRDGIADSLLDVESILDALANEEKKAVQKATAKSKKITLMQKSIQEEEKSMSICTRALQKLNTRCVSKEKEAKAKNDLIERLLGASTTSSSSSSSSSSSHSTTMAMQSRIGSIRTILAELHDLEEGFTNIRLLSNIPRLPSILLLLSYNTCLSYLTSLTYPTPLSPHQTHLHHNTSTSISLRSNRDRRMERINSTHRTTNPRTTRPIEQTSPPNHHNPSRTRTKHTGTYTIRS